MKHRLSVFDQQQFFRNVSMVIGNSILAISIRDPSRITSSDQSGGLDRSHSGGCFGAFGKSSC